MDETAWDERYRTSDYVWTITANRFVAEHLADLAPGDAIDLGAGEGRNAVWLAERGWRVTAVDFSPVGMEKAQRLAADHKVVVETVVADALTYEPGRQVELVVLSYLQLPRSEQRVVLDHAEDWLQPGGTLFVIAHDETNVEQGYGGPPSPEVCYSVCDTVAALEGLEIVRAEVAERPVETDAGIEVALDTLVIARRPAG